MVDLRLVHILWIWVTSIVSMLTKEYLSAAETTIIYVMDDNASANRVYTKVGFKPYKSYFFVKHG